MANKRKRRASTDPSLSADTSSTTSSDIGTKVARLSFDHQSAPGPRTSPRPMQNQTRRAHVQPPVKGGPIDPLMTEFLDKFDPVEPARDSNEDAAKKATGSVISTSTAMELEEEPFYKKQASEVYQAIVDVQGKKADKWFNPEAIQTFKSAFGQPKHQQTLTFPPLLAKYIKFLQMVVDKHQKHLAKLKRQAAYFKNFEGFRDGWVKHLEAAIQSIENTLSEFQRFVKVHQARYDRLSRPATQAERGQTKV